MKRVMILLAGYPATGKTYLANQIISECGAFEMVSQDTLKENIFDEFGYKDIEEKKFLIDESWIRYYSNMRILMNQGKRIISDYPFSGQQYDTLKELAKRFHYHVVTVRLIGDLDVLYERSRKRDLDPTRHLSHLVYSYHLGDTLGDRSKAEGFLTYDVFVDRCKNKGYGEFRLGDLIEVDVTDFSKVDYPVITRNVKKLIE